MSITFYPAKVRHEIKDGKPWQFIDFAIEGADVIISWA